MTLIVDAGPLLCLADRDDPRQPAVVRVMRAERGPLRVPAPVTAEVDYVLRRRHGSSAADAFLDDLAAERLVADCLEPEDYAVVSDLNRRYSDLRPGLADLSVVALARRFGTRRILTFDERHFRAITPLQGGAFKLLPADA